MGARLGVRVASRSVFIWLFNPEPTATARSRCTDAVRRRRWLRVKHLRDLCFFFDGLLEEIPQIGAQRPQQRRQGAGHDLHAGEVLPAQEKVVPEDAYMVGVVAVALNGDAELLRRGTVDGDSAGQMPGAVGHAGSVR